MIEGGNGASFDLSVNDASCSNDVGGNGGQVTNTYPVGTAYSVTETLGNGDAVDPAVWETTLSGDCAGTSARATTRPAPSPTSASPSSPSSR